MNRKPACVETVLGTRPCLFRHSIFLLSIATAAYGQAVIATLPVTGQIAVNRTTNKVYVSTSSGITVIDGATNSLTTIPIAGAYGGPIAVNDVTNKVYLLTGTLVSASLGVLDGSHQPVLGYRRHHH